MFCICLGFEESLWVSDRICSQIEEVEDGNEDDGRRTSGSCYTRSGWLDLHKARVKEHQKDGNDIRKSNKLESNNTKKMVIEQAIDEKVGRTVTRVALQRIHAYERSSRVYDYTLDPCGPVHITTCDGGNQENMVAEYADEPSNRQPEYNAYRESSFGYDILEIFLSYLSYLETMEDPGITPFMASGLKINIHKSKIMGIGTSHEEVSSAANIIGCNTFSSPFSYLGVKVGSSSSRSKFWEEVVAKLSSRLWKWKVKTLSIGGHFTLIKYVLSSLPIYQMSIYKIHVGVLRNMESIRRRFFNGGDINENKMSMIGWEKIMASRKKGGLGIPSFFAQICGSLDIPGTITRSSTWTNIIREFNLLSSKGINLLSYMKKKVGNGMNTLFWVDVWLNDSPLMHLYPRMFALECNKYTTVADKLNDISIARSFRRPPRGGLEEEQVTSLIDDVKSVILLVSNYRWVWSIDSSGGFSVKSTRLYIDDYLLPAVGSPARWVKEIPIKIYILAWKVSLDKLPTRLNLSLRGIEIPTISCPICSFAGESCSHLLFSCNMARILINKVARWWELDIPNLLSYEERLDWFKVLRLPKGIKDILEGAFRPKLTPCFFRKSIGETESAELATQEGRSSAALAACRTLVEELTEMRRAALRQGKKPEVSDIREKKKHATIGGVGGHYGTTEIGHCAIGGAHHTGGIGLGGHVGY
ncbi:RNA-directed DNA polymerase, eukaryota, reverse transcriptase zinc-binding domain protein [Tanacetum coccineum]